MAFTRNTPSGRKTVLVRGKDGVGQEDSGASAVSGVLVVLALAFPWRVFG
jgi:hypothetical protein